MVQQHVSSESSTNVQYDVNVPLNTAMSHYDVLYVCPTATMTTIKDAYHSLVKRYHPDKQRKPNATVTDISASYDSPTNGSDKDFIQIQTAWECLRDPKLRSVYDSQLQQHQTRRRQRQQNSIPITMEDCRQERQLIEIEVDIDHDIDHDDDASPCDYRSEMVVVINYIYQCRCGHDIHVAQRQPPQLYGSSPRETDSPIPLFVVPQRTTTDLRGECSMTDDDDDMFRHCVGCSVIYDIRLIFQNEANDAGMRHGYQ